MTTKKVKVFTRSQAIQAVEKIVETMSNQEMIDALKDAMPNLIQTHDIYIGDVCPINNSTEEYLKPLRLAIDNFVGSPAEKNLKNVTRDVYPPYFTSPDGEIIFRLEQSYLFLPKAINRVYGEKDFKKLANKMFSLVQEKDALPEEPIVNLIIDPSTRHVHTKVLEEMFASLSIENKLRVKLFNMPKHIDIKDMGTESFLLERIN